jgi:outer membrane protein assembly factor BamB
VPRRSSVILAGLFSVLLPVLEATTQAADAPRRKFVAADSSKQRVAIVDEAGKIVWERRIGPLHDLHVLPNGHLLLQDSWTKLVEVDSATDEVVWTYDSATSNGNTGQKVEVHAFQRLDDGVTMIAESGPARIIEVDREGRLLKSFPLKVENPHPHRDTRLARKLGNGHYLVCHEGDGTVVEYDADGQPVWEFAVPLFGRERADGHGVEAFGNQAFSAVRLESGNTLIGTGNGHSVIEVTPGRKIVWELHQNDLPGIQLAWVTTLQVLPSGNIVLGNCHAGPTNPQIVEVDRDKQVVWTFKDFERFGNALTNTVVLAVDGKPID